MTPTAAVVFTGTAVALTPSARQLGEIISVGWWVDNLGQILGAALGAGLAWWAGSWQIKKQWEKEHQKSKETNRIKTEHFFEDVFHSLFSMQAKCRLYSGYTVTDVIMEGESNETNKRRVAGLNRIVDQGKELREKYNQYREYLPKPVKENMQLLFSKIEESAYPIILHGALIEIGRPSTEDAYTSRLSETFYGINAVVRKFIPFIEDPKLRTQLDNGSMTYPPNDKLVMPDEPEEGD